MRRIAAAAAYALLLCAPRDGFAIDSYRYLHVSIETPWTIFLFLLMMMFIPFVLMVALMWRQMRRNRSAARKAAPPGPGEGPP